jgi:hypothetical protein
LGERSGALSGLRPSSFVMCNTPVEVQFTSAGCLNYPCRTPVVRRLAPGLSFGEGLKLNDEMKTLVPPKQIGGMFAGEEAMQLILELAELRRNPDHSGGSTASA